MLLWSLVRVHAQARPLVHPAQVGYIDRAPGLPALPYHADNHAMSILGTLKQKASDFMGWSSGGMMTPTGEDRLGVIPNELTPAFISRAIKAADSGSLGLLQESYMKMIASDPHLRGEVNKVGFALSEYPLRVSVAKTRSEDAKRAAEMMEEVLSNPAFKTRHAIRSMAKVHFHGVRLYENDLRVESGEDGITLLEGLDIVPPTRYKMEMDKTEADYGGLRILDRDTPEGVPIGSLPEGSLTQINDEMGNGFWDLGGVGRTCLFWFCAKHFNAKWWNEFNETYGEPIRVGYYDPWSDEEDRREMRKFLQELGRAAWAILPSTQEFEFLMPDLGQVKTYEDVIYVADQQISKAIVGQIGSSGRDEHGSYGELEGLEGIRYEVVKAVAGMIEESLHPTVHFLCKANIDPAFSIRDVPRVYIVVPNPGEKTQKAQLFQSALEIGLPIGKQHAYDELGIPVPNESDEVLEPGDLLRRPDGASQPGNTEPEHSPSGEEKASEEQASSASAGDGSDE